MSDNKFWLMMVFILLIGYYLHSQSETRKVEHNVGLHAGLFNGGGLSYRFIFDKVGAQVTGFVFNTRQQELVKSIGGSVYYLFNEKKEYQFFTFFGGFKGSSDRRSESDMHLPLEKRYKDVLAIGWGIGCSARLGKKFKFNFQLGPQYVEFKEKQTIFFAAGTGFYYCF